ncbi:MAG: hypothetical protein KGZ60_08765 [Truepera sp.]|nr:hypothetical protein [Truepera sp.]
MRQDDVLIGVGDGATWIDQLFDCLGVEQRILDVYHASLYLEQVLASCDPSRRTGLG